MTDRRCRSRALGLMAASGFAALGYQIVWTQQAAVWLGHEAAAVLAVVAAFFGGLAAGALMLGPRIDASPHPGRWYAACEAAIGLWALALAVLMAPASEGLLALIGPQPSPAWQWFVAFCGTFILLLPATAAMGATLPAMERVMTQLKAQLHGEGSSIAVLYAGNTFGAVIGVLGTAFWLVPQFGLLRASIACAVLNLVCAAVALKIFGEGASPPRARSSSSGTLWLLAATGFLGIGYEVLVVRVLSQVSENTVYTFAILLAVYLVGTALGAAEQARRPLGRERLLWMLAAACLLGTASLWGAEAAKALALRALGPGMAAAIAAEAILAVAAFLLPTFAMGMVFSRLSTDARTAGTSFGHALGVNTLAAAAAPLLFGVLLLPSIGPKLALLAVVGGYLALSLVASRTPAAWITAVAALAVAALAPRLAFVDVPQGGHVVSYADGVVAAVSVVEDAGGVARLRIDNRQQEGSSATLIADSRQALLPLLLHPSPRRALFLGLGTGVTASAAAEDPQIEVDAVELLPEVVEASAHFRRGAPSPRLHLIVADARRYVRATRERYDLVVSDNFHPARSGSGSLYTVEHFRAVRERLAPGGVFCQWLPLHQLDLGTLRSIARTFAAVYPVAFAMVATNSLETPVVGLVARADGSRFDVEEARGRLAGIEIPSRLGAFGLDDDLALLGSFFAGPSSLARFAGDAPLNTDDRPVVAYTAPRITYAPDSLPRDRLIALLRETEIRPDELVSADSAWSARLARYWSARNRFIEAGRDVRPAPDARIMLAQVREPLLAVLRISPDFRPAYDPLLRMAQALGRSDPAAARVLLAELRQVQPARPEAVQALRDISGG